MDLTDTRITTGDNVRRACIGAGYKSQRSLAAHLSFTNKKLSGSEGIREAQIRRPFI